jgi:WD repeat-containing protein 35
VLKLEVVASTENTALGVAAQTALSMNQTLEGHKGAVLRTTWNSQHKKLTTSDSSGLIIVWVFRKGAWYEEMINNRGTSRVADMRWRSNGQEIAIAYEDGMIIIGGVEGNRLWSKDLGAEVRFVEWAPDGRSLLFGMASGKVLVHTHTGVHVGELAGAGAAAVARLVGIEWYDGVEGLASADQCALAVGWSDGRLQLFRDAEDGTPKVIETSLNLTLLKWNSNGTVLAVAGASKSGGGSEVHFYSPHGRGTLINVLRVPGSAIEAASWEGGGLRLALAVDGFVYFAAVRPQYWWAYFSGTLAYAYARPDRSEALCVFLNAKAESRVVKYVKGLLGMAGYGEHCLLVTRVAVEQQRALDDDGGAGAGVPEASTVKRQTTLILCNSMGTPIENRSMDVEPEHIAIGPTHVAIASSTSMYVWQFKASGGGGKGGAPELLGASVSSRKRGEGRERVFELDGGDAIVCLTMSETVLLVGRASGSVVVYSLPTVVQEAVYTLRCRPAQLALNSTSTRFSVIDSGNTLTFFDMESRGADGRGGRATAEHLTSVERKDAWAVLWADDAPELCAVMEKTRLYVLRDGSPEEPVLSSGYLCAFSGLTITSALMDDVYATPDRPPPPAAILVNHDVRSLRDTRKLLLSAAPGMRDATSFVEDKAHPRLWRLLAESALERLELSVAERAFVAIGDYGGLQFAKKLRVLSEAAKQAEVSSYLGRFDEAEAMYIAADRRDLALDMRQRLEDWPRVLALLEAPNAGSSAEAIRLACERMGKWCAERQQWRNAVVYHERSGSLASLEALTQLYGTLEEFGALERMVGRMPPGPAGAAALSALAFRLQSVGLTDAAVNAYLKAGDSKSAVDCCIALSQWDRALGLALQHSMPDVTSLLNTSVAALLEAGRLMPAVELYRKSARHADSARVLTQLGLASLASRFLLRAKKLFVLSALEVQRHRAMTTTKVGGVGSGMASTSPTRAGAGATAAAALDTLTRLDGGEGGEGGAASRALDSAWHSAAGVHFFMLAQRQLYAGDPASALLTAGCLSSYEDVLPAKDVAAVTALAAHYAGAHAAASRALCRYKAMDGVSSADADAVEAIALAIFGSHRPTNAAPFSALSLLCRSCRAPNRALALACGSCGAGFTPCVATGRPLGDGTAVAVCGTCKHAAAKDALRGHKTCPLCHTAL